MQNDRSNAKSSATVALSLYHNYCDSTTIPLRHDYEEKLTFSVFACVEWQPAHAIRRSRIVVVS